eukprot:sb/3473746/
MADLTSSSAPRPRNMVKLQLNDESISSGPGDYDDTDCPSDFENELLSEDRGYYSLGDSFKQSLHETLISDGFMKEHVDTRHHHAALGETNESMLGLYNFQTTVAFSPPEKRSISLLGLLPISILMRPPSSYGQSFFFSSLMIFVLI